MPTAAHRPAAHREEIWVPGMPEPISHFVHVVRAGRLVFVSGCVASDDQGRTVGGSDIVAQTRQTHENIKRCLAAAGATFADVCKVTVFLKNVGIARRSTRCGRSTSARVGPRAP